MPSKFFKLNISANNYLAYYRGQSQMVETQAEDGQRLQFPAIELRDFITHTGIQGRFEIIFTDEGKLIELRQVD